MQEKKKSFPYRKFFCRQAKIGEQFLHIEEVYISLQPEQRAKLNRRFKNFQFPITFKMLVTQLKTETKKED